MIKRVVVGVAAVALATVGAGVALAQAGENGGDRPATVAHQYDIIPASAPVEIHAQAADAEQGNAQESASGWEGDANI
ncbi:hypothetical protein [Kitasatospora sp. NPDC093806]|uniref:hypothetical protein n=1 Tax=Kitasatospora sp. NPDC093806 TaxID=3155075 RepID=UPI00342BD7C3